MRKNIVLLLVVFSAAWLYTTKAYTQVGTISTYAAISACNIAVDNAGKVYTANGSHVYRVDSGGAETSVAGGGTSYGDGGPATAGQIGDAYNLAFDNSGNMYIADAGYSVIRKVNTSGIMSTIAGNHTLGSGYTGDGGAATAAKLNVTNVCTDGFGNVYIADMTDFVIRKVSSSGMISTVAGNGSEGNTGDGGAATAAQLDNYTEANIWGITTDFAGNLYISEGHDYRVRKVNTSGIITTIAGNGSTGAGGLGGPATAASVYYPEGLTTDGSGNLYISEWQNCVLAVMNTAGILSTVAGNYTISYGGDGGAATAAGMNAVSDAAIDPSGNIYIADCHNSRIRKVTGSYLSSTYVADSFGITMNGLCSGPQLTIVTRSYSPAYTVKCYYGDGTRDSSAIAPGLSGSGFISFTHAYNLPGTYTIKTVLMNSGIVFDSLSYTYVFRLCNTLSTQYYYDANSDCVFDAGDSRLSLPILTEVDSNGITIDTLSSTGGIYYTAYGRPGDVYTFKTTSYPGSMHATCPTTGVITDTLQSITYNTNQKYIGLQCTSAGSYDLSLNAVVPVTGVRDEWGNIYVSNSYCAPEDATVTVYFSKHYQASEPGGGLDISPTPTSYTDSSITWNVSGLDGTASAPVDLYYAIWVNPDSGLVVGYPVQSHYSVYPTISDVNAANNFEIITDTVKGGCDPNEMTVSPSGYIAAGSQLQYTINFTNAGNDTTYNIYVMDTLSDNVDVSSFRLAMASATMNVLKYASDGHNILKFDFPGINLLDSADYPKNCSSGLVFTVNVKSGLPAGTKIFNHAGVFFDYNPVVMTDSVENIIAITASGVNPANHSANISVYPNPATTILTISSTNQLINHVNIINVLGQTIYTGTYNEAQVQVSVTDLPSGLYFAKINGSEVLRFAKE